MTTSALDAVLKIAEMESVDIKANGASPDGDESDNEGAKKSQATQIVDLCLASDIDLWHDPEGTPYATIKVDQHYENWAIRSTRFRRWLKHQFYNDTGKVPNAQAMQDAMGILEGQALFDGDEHQVFTRLAEHDGKIYLDLANVEWQAVEITPGGWRVVSEPHVKFRRSKGMMPLPTPINGGDVNLLRPFINLREDDENNWRLLVAYLVQALRPIGPYPVLVVHGEQGSAKTTLVRMIRMLIDPNLADCRSQPRDERDLMIAARNGWIVALDNLSSISPWLSDALCRLSTGGALATRTLYTDDDETLFKAQCPVILNGITELATRGDLLDRSILITLAAIPDDQRRSEKAIWAEFEAVRPRVLGGLLDAVSEAMANVGSVQLDTLPRMADFAEWATAAESSLGWPEGSFMKAYTDNRQTANETALEASPVTGAIISVLEDNSEIEESATDLLTLLNGKVSEKVQELKAWPKSGASLSRALKRLSPNLRGVEIEVEFKRDDKHRTISIQKVYGKSRQRRHAVMDTDAQARNQLENNDGIGDERRQITVMTDENAVMNFVPETVYHDDNDGNDGVKPTQSNEVFGEV